MERIFAKPTSMGFCTRCVANDLVVGIKIHPFRFARASQRTLSYESVSTRLPALSFSPPVFFLYQRLFFEENKRVRLCFGSHLPPRRGIKPCMRSHVPRRFLSRGATFPYHRIRNGSVSSFGRFLSFILEASYRTLRLPFDFL